MISYSYILTIASSYRGILSEGPTGFDFVPTLPGWQALLLLILLIIILVLALYVNARLYQVPVNMDSHGEGHQAGHSHAAVEHGSDAMDEMAEV